jgi:hypothetical protein
VWRRIDSEHESSLDVEEEFIVQNAEQETHAPYVEEKLDWASSWPSLEHMCLNVLL